MFQVQASPCETCIYKPAMGFNIAELEAQVADKHGGFKGFRECHNAKRGSQVCCRGFWNRHKNKFSSGQIAQRLNCVEFVTAKNGEVLCSTKK